MWLALITRLERTLRPSTPCYQRFDRAARQLTAARIAACTDAEAVALLERLLRAARYPTGFGRLDRVWTRADLGELITAATNQGRLLAMGRTAPKPKGPRLDPRALPDDRLAWLIQHHADLHLVEALRAERRRREAHAHG